MFNLRVYGLWINNNNILVVQEPVKGKQITKFPGGGLEFGEGTIDCLRREFREELQLEISSLTHFYTTDFFVQSFINPQHQVISIYYLVEADPQDAVFENDEGLQFTWISLQSLHQDMFDLPIDKLVVGMIVDAHQ
jgi:ADP-ribose pyrophosphatase YjhB (NUDIX family)